MIRLKFYNNFSLIRNFSAEGGFQQNFHTMVGNVISLIHEKLYFGDRVPLIKKTNENYLRVIL